MVSSGTQMWIDRIRDYAWDNDIGILSSTQFDPHTVCHSIPEHRLVVINANYEDSQQLPFQFAHEIGHIINGDTDKSKFSFSKVHREGMANLFAIRLLVPWYYENVEEDEASSRWFVESFHLSDSMQNWVDEEVIGFYKRTAGN